jgi:hypothetical protein
MRLILILLLLSQYAFAQPSESIGVSITLPSVALLDIEPDRSGFNLALIPSVESENTTVATNNSKWLNFTSAVSVGTNRRITAQISGTLPPGLALKLEVQKYTGTGKGTLGNPVSPIYLSNSQQTILNNIGGAFTGNGLGNGFNLIYSLEIIDYSVLKHESTSFSILYTFTDN